MNDKRRGECRASLTMGCLESSGCHDRSIEHVRSEHVEERREDALQRFRVDGVRHLGAERSSEDTHDRDGKERGQVNVAERVGEAGKGGFRPTAHDVADRARESDRKAERRRGTDRLVHRSTRAEMVPMQVPAPTMPAVPGRPRDASTFFEKNIFVAE